MKAIDCKEISDYESVLKKIDHDDSKDVIKIDRFDKEEIKLVQNLIKKIRICKAYRDGRPIPKRGERRYYPWYDVSSGFDFDSAFCAAAFAGTSSASRLCFLTREDCLDYNNKFGQTIEKAIVDVK